MTCKEDWSKLPFYSEHKWDEKFEKCEKCGKLFWVYMYKVQVLMDKIKSSEN